MGNGLLRAVPLLVAGKPILVVLAPNCSFKWDMSLEKVRGEGGPGAVRAQLLWRILKLVKKTKILD